MTRRVREVVVGSLLCATLVYGSAGAMQFSSSDFLIDAATLNNVGGFSSSTNYQLTSSGGEAAIGNGISGSYMMPAGYVAQLPSMISVKTEPSGLSAYYPLDENSGTATYDASANASSGTLENGAAWYGSGQIGSAVDMNATGDVHIPYSSALPSGQGLTVEAWMRMSAATGQSALVTQWDYSGGVNHGGVWALQKTPSGDGMRFFLANGSGDAGSNYVDTSSGILTANTWYHVVATYDGTQAAGSRIKIYVNGISQPLTVNGAIAASLNAGNTPDLYIGDFHGLSRQFNGAIDQVKIFNRALSADEVKAEYTAQNAGIETGLTLQTITPGASNSSAFNVFTQTTSGGYNLAINQDHDLQNGSNTLPAISGSIASPIAWSEGNTKGLGFTLTSTNATAIAGSWNAGAAYAALPNSATTFYTRTGTQSVKDVLAMQLRADAATSQPSGAYANTMTITGTTNP